MGFLFTGINFVIFLTFIIALSFIMIGLFGGWIERMRQDKQKSKQNAKDKWFSLFKRGIIVLVVSIALLFAVNIVRSILPCELGGLCIVIEDKGKINVSHAPEVKALIYKYGKNHVHIMALDIDLIKDINFIKQINPSFKEQTGCIIVVHAGDEGYVYQEDKELNIIYRETIQEFMEKTKNVDPQIMAKFYLSLH